jgi:predicted RNA-binding protein YlqC (UPF0109 family)
MTHEIEVNSESVYLASLVSPLLSQPNELAIECKTDEKGVLLTLTVHPTDMGRVIGKGGETARSIRHLLRQYGMGQQAHVAMKINEPARV